MTIINSAIILVGSELFFNNYFLIIHKNNFQYIFAFDLTAAYCLISDECAVYIMNCNELWPLTDEYCSPT